MMLLPILLVAVYLGTGNCFSTKSFTGAFSSNSGLDVREAKSVRALSRYFGMKFLRLETQ